MPAKRTHDDQITFSARERRIDRMMSLNDAMVFGGIALGLVGLSCMICVGLCSLARRYAPRWGFVDRPGGHKGHRTPTPLGGGVAIWLTIVSVLAIGLLTRACTCDLLLRRRQPRLSP